MLVDDHALVRRGFRRLLEDEADIEIVAEASNGREAVELAKEHAPQVIVMDYSMPELDGVQATIEIRRRVPDSAVLMLSMHADESYQRNAFEAGARGYLFKNAAHVDLAGAIRDIAAGGMCGAPVPESFDQPLEELTPREKQILQLIAQGRSNKEIAALLGLSVNTVSVHRNNLMHKMNVHRTAELVMAAIRKGLVTPP
ncbi:MAG TPA: response regulator transcription factor [Bryobacteraceae bacterium]|nr:response regulator transcription factor [Bryobacteraceae bacterium]